MAGMLDSVFPPLRGKQKTAFHAGSGNRDENKVSKGIKTAFGAEMDAKAANLMRALCDPTTSTAEALSGMNADGSLIRVAKPSSEPETPWIIEVRPLDHCTPAAVRVR